MDNISTIQQGNPKLNAMFYAFEECRKHTEIEQNLAKEYYRMKYSELAKKLAEARTGQIIVVDDDKALWLDGYIEAYTEEDSCEAIFVPSYEPLSFDSASYNDCAHRVDKAIILHHANKICEDLRTKQQQQRDEAAKLGYPQNLYYPFRECDTGPEYRTLIIGYDGVMRERDFTIGDTDKSQYYEGWSQLMPKDIIATWEKPSLSEPHYFKLELYISIDDCPEELRLLAEENPSTSLIHVTLDSDMPVLSIEQQQSLQSCLSIAQLECLGDEQAQIRCGFSNAIEPIFGGASPDIEGGWLGLLGIEQSYVIDFDEQNQDDSESDAGDGV